MNTRLKTIKKSEKNGCNSLQMRVVKTILKNFTKLQK